MGMARSWPYAGDHVCWPGFWVALGHWCASGCMDRGSHGSLKLRFVPLWNDVLTRPANSLSQKRLLTVFPEACDLFPSVAPTIHGERYLSRLPPLQRPSQAAFRLPDHRMVLIGFVFCHSFCYSETVTHSFYLNEKNRTITVLRLSAFCDLCLYHGVEGYFFTHL